MTCIKGRASLKNTKAYPFNNSLTTVPLPVPAANTLYSVLAVPVSADGEVGDILVSGKARNGFKLAFTGSASHVEVLWTMEEAL